MGSAIALSMARKAAEERSKEIGFSEAGRPVLASPT
jgi:hypothetical protein